MKERLRRREENKGKAEDMQTHWQILQETTLCNPLQADIKCKQAFFMTHLSQDFFWSLCLRYMTSEGLSAQCPSRQGQPAQQSTTAWPHLDHGCYSLIQQCYN